MDGMNRFGWAIAMLAATIMLSGCSSFMQGDQYVFPLADEPSATLRTEYKAGTDLHLMNLNDKGCYAGYTPLPYVNGVIESPVAVEKKLVVTYRRESVGKVCQIIFSFIPEKSATYTLTAGSWSETKNGIVPWLTDEQQFCGVAMVKEIGGAETIEPVQKLRIDAGITCHKFVK